jgi:hypothetical protein
MSEQEKQENQKTIVAFAAGLLIGGLLVWVFGGATPKSPTDQDENATTTEEVEGDVEGDATTSPSENDDDEDDDEMEMKVGNGAVDIDDQKAGASVALNSATFPSDEGWIGVRDYVDGQIGGILGVARFSKEQGLIPQAVTLQRATRAGNTYAIVFFSENGDRIFNTANDKQAEGVVATFNAVEK